MGTDCKPIAKLKDGTYRWCEADRHYVFNWSLGTHDGLFEAYEYSQKFDHEGKFPIQHGIDWAKERLELLHNGQFHEDDMIDAEKASYHINWVTNLQKFLEQLNPDEVEWVGVINDSDDLYWEVFSIENTNISGKIVKVEIDNN